MLLELLATDLPEAGQALVLHALSMASKYHLTSREATILDLIAVGKGDKEIARSLGISIRTVRTHLEHVFVRLGVHTRAEAIAALGISTQTSAGRFANRGKQ